MITKKLAEYGSQLASVDPELMDFSNTRKGPVTAGAVAMLEKMMDGVAGNYQGIDAMGYVVGLWDPAMMPGADGGFARTNADPFWYSLGRKYSSKILAGRFGIRDAINLTSKQLKQMGLNYINLASRRTDDTSHEYDTYENAETMDSGTVGSEYFRALNNPSHRWHNRAKEFWQSAIQGRLGPNVHAVVQAFLELGATERGGIKGGYGAAQAWINERMHTLGLEREISTKGVKKAWEKVKEQFAAKFQAGMSDEQWSDLWIGLADEMDLNATFSRNDGMQIVYNERMASIVKRHAYRQVLRQRTDKTAIREKRIPKGDFAIIISKGMDDFVASVHKTEAQALEVLKRKHGIEPGPHNPMGAPKIVDVSRRGPWEIIPYFGKLTVRPKRA